MNESFNIRKLNNIQKLNYIKNVLFNENLTISLEGLLKDEKKNLEITSLILKALDDKVVFEKLKKQVDSKNVKMYVYSKILGIFLFYKKEVILGEFLKSLSDKDRKELAYYEYQNKTNVSINSKSFNRYCKKYKDEALNDLEKSDEEVLMLTTEMNKYNNLLNVKPKKRKKHVLPIVFASVFLLATIVLCYKSYTDIKLVNEYDGMFIPGIYINEINLNGKKMSELDSIVSEEKNKIESGTIIVNNVNGSQKYTYKEINISVDKDKLISEVNDYINDLSVFKKAKMIKEGKKVKVFNLEGSFDESAIDSLVERLETQLNTLPRNDSINVDNNHNVSYDAGVDGFVLDKEKTKDNIKKALVKIQKEVTVESVGNVVKRETKYASLASINTKISTYTTGFNNSGNRGFNINHAASKLNGTVLLPGETFSYLKTVGPYNAANGYLSAPLYSNGVLSTGAGGGVCQLATTLYNAQLRAGLEIVYRTNHAYAPAYVPLGLDATVFSTTTDYKFKNNLEYPIYILAYSHGNYLTVDMWSNDKALGGKTYEPYAIYSNGGYLAYLKTIENGKVIEQKYLNKSYYKTH